MASHKSYLTCTASAFVLNSPDPWLPFPQATSAKETVVGGAHKAGESAQETGGEQAGRACDDADEARPLPDD